MITKEFLEEQGWKVSFDFRHLPLSRYITFTKGDIWKSASGGKPGGAFLDLYLDGRLIIKTTDEGENRDGPNYSAKFNGVCPDEKTYHLLTTLITLP